MSRTINRAIERHIISGTTLAVVQPFARKLIAEWQQRGPETLFGHTLQKLRLAFVPAQSATTAGVVD